MENITKINVGGVDYEVRKDLADKIAELQEQIQQGTGSGGTTDYTDLENKPKINGHELSGNQSSEDLGLQQAGDYALKSEIPDTGNFATKEELNNITPTIGENGNWFINGEDTGKPANGKDGADGVSLGEIALVQETGTESGSENKVMSQKAVSEKLTELDNKNTFFFASQPPYSSENNKIYNGITEASTAVYNYVEGLSLSGGVGSILKQGTIIAFISNNNHTEVWKYAGNGISFFKNEGYWERLDNYAFIKKGDFTSLKNAISAINVNFRELGMVYSFSINGENFIYQYFGSDLETESFNNENNWKRISYYNEITVYNNILNVNIINNNNSIYTFETAVSTLPAEKYGKVGRMITFLSRVVENSCIYETWQYIAESLTSITWVSKANWKRVDDSDYIINAGIITSVGAMRGEIPKWKRKKGLFVIYQLNNKLYLSQYISDVEYENTSTSQFNTETNWITIEVKKDEGKSEVNTIDSFPSKYVKAFFDDTFEFEYGYGYFGSDKIFHKQDINNKVGTTLLYYVKGIDTISFPDIYKVDYLGWNDTGERVLYAIGKIDEQTKLYEKGVSYLGMNIVKSDGSEITEDDLDNIRKSNAIHIKWYDRVNEDKQIDKTDALNDATVINEWDKDLIAHASNSVFDEKGNLYTVYLTSYNSATDSGFGGNGLVKLVINNICDFSDRKFYEVIKYDESVGNFVPGNSISPWECNCELIEDYLYVIFQANNKNDEYGTRCVIRKFNITSKTFDKEIIDMYLRYNDENFIFSCINFADIFYKATGVQIPVSTYMNTNYQIQKYNEYYYLYLSFVSTSSPTCQGMLIRSTDLITWEFVSVNTTLNNSENNVWEAALKIINDKVYIYTRADVNNFMYYDLNDNKWSDIYSLSRVSASRTFLWYDELKQKLYAIGNLSNEKLTTTVGQIFRSVVAIDTIDLDTMKSVRTQKIKQSNSLQYYNIVSYKGRNLIVFTEGRRMLTTDCKDNLSIHELNFIE